MTAHHVTPDQLATVNDGDEIEISGEAIYIGDPTVFLPEPGNGRTGRVVTLFVETDEDPGTFPRLDSAGNPIDDATFADLTVAPGSAAHVAGSGGPVVADSEPAQ